MPKIGILLTNTGTPDAPTPSAVRRYLREFLSDRRIVHLPRLVWLPILYGLILPFRSRRSAHLYQQIWTAEGSPMRVIMQKIQEKLGQKMEVEIGMNYGSPSIQQGLDRLRAKQVDQVIILPLFPQYSNTTTASTFDRVTHALQQWPALPALHFIRDYADHPSYIRALAQSVHDTTHLLISFHGIPERFVQAGDPYRMRCEQTAALLAEALALPKDKWTLCFQSQFGYDKWLQPSTQRLLAELPKRGIKQVEVICPGFSVDCLETLEEIALRGKKTFLQAGGESLRYLPALNDHPSHIDMLVQLIKNGEVFKEN
ncbi:MAG: ferrochelatase [Gammaproteobacteria bacterium]|nr:MAG: ferrochelatase [Gammaproteobacteria bacterium]